MAPEYDLSAHDLDGEVVKRAGGGKEHGRFWIGDGIIDTASTPTLPYLSTEHQFQPGDTPTARLYTVPDEHTLGYFCFIHRSLIFIYFCIAL